MKLLSKTLALSVAFSALLICAPVAHAADAPATSVATTEKFPAAVIAVVDIQRILKESAAAKSLREQLSPRQQAVQKQIATEEDKLRKEQLDLMQQRSKMSDEQFSAKISEFQKKADIALRKSIVLLIKRQRLMRPSLKLWQLSVKMLGRL